MSDPFSLWTGHIVLAGLFLVFLAHFSRFVLGEIWPLIKPLVEWVLKRWSP